MKLWELEQCLQEVTGFKKPKIELEQYPTSAHVASRVLYTAHTSFGDIEDKIVADLGCGNGILACGASILGAGHVIGVDVDVDALDGACENVENLELDGIDFIRDDITRINPRMAKKFDTVIMNPPFGTRQKGIDMKFLKAGIELSSGAVYSFHKTSTRAHILKKAKEWRVAANVIAELRFDIPKMYSFHKKEEKDIEVDLIRLSFIRGQ